MSQPHHFVFNELQRAIQASVPIEPLLPYLLKKEIIKETDVKKFSGKNGMRNLTSALRNKSYETFVRFVECIIEAGSSDPSVKLSIVQPIEKAVVQFDKEHGTTHASTLQSRKKSELSSHSATDSDVQHTSTIGEMPNFEYIGDIAVHTFDATGGECDVSPFDFKLTVPCGAVPDGQTVTVKIGVMTHGPFRLPHDHYLITDYYCVIADSEFVAPVSVQMPHCAILSEYKQSSDIQVMRSDLNSVTTNGEYIFNPLPFFPDISDTFPHLSFEIRDFCVLCSTATRTKSSRIEKPRSHLERQGAFDRPALVSSPQSSTEEHEVHRSRQFVYDAQFSSSHEEESSLLSSQEASAEDEIVRRKPSRKRTSESDRSDSYEKKPRCSVEYCLLMFQPMPKDKTPPFQACMFACLSCPGSREACTKQMKNENWNWRRPAYREFEFDNTSIDSSDKKLVFEISKTTGWQICADKEPLEIRESEIQTHRKLPAEYRRLAKKNFYPPRLTFDVFHTCSTEMLNCKIGVRGATTPIVLTINAPIPENVRHSGYLHPMSLNPTTPHSVAFPLDSAASVPCDRTPSMHQDRATELDAASDRDDLASQLMNVQIQRSMSEEDKEHLDKHVTHYCLTNVSQHISAYSWKALGRELGLDEISLENVEHDTRNERGVELIYQMLLLWKKQNDSESTYRILIEALAKVEQIEASNYVATHVAEFVKSD